MTVSPADGPGGDRRLCRTLEPDAASVERIIRAALAAGDVRRRRLGPRVALATAGLALAALAATLWLRPRPGAAPPAGIQITNHGAVLAVREPSGHVWLRDGSGEPLGGGPRLIILEGDKSDG